MTLRLWFSATFNKLQLYKTQMSLCTVVVEGLSTGAVCFQNLLPTVETLCVYASHQRIKYELSIEKCLLRKQNKSWTQFEMSLPTVFITG